VKLLHVIIGLEVGGAELMLKRLLESQRDSIHRHTVVSLTTLGIVGQQMKASGIDVRSLGMHSAFDIPRTLWKLVRLIRSARPDIVQTWMYHSDLLGGLAARLAGHSNVVWGIRTTEVSAGGSRTTVVVRNLCALLSRYVPRKIICAASAACKAHVDIGYDPASMVVVPNGFNIAHLVASAEERASLRFACGFQEEIIVIGSIGRFNPVKDQRNFVRAMGKLAQKHHSIRFLMVGRGLDSDNTELVRWIAETGYTSRFVLLGERADVPVCLAALDIFCMHSRTEGFPNVVGEAMAMGLPCVVTDVGDAAMLVADTGVVVPKQNPVLLAHGIEQILSMPLEERKQLGNKAKERIRSTFSIEHASKQFAQIYKSLLDN
jgi:glycosyltransferase involved in cell wall biosynthesis